MSLYFISDLHLSPSLEQTDALFSKTLKTWQGNIEALYILGDLFDAWIGDDDDNEYAVQKLQQLHLFAQATPLFIMPGNRDFLFGRGFASASGATLLEDPYLISYQGRHYLLSHGDELCTDDIAYQQFRKIIRNPAWQTATLAKPLEERRALAQQLRTRSMENTQQVGKTAISDVTETGVQSILKNYRQNETLPILIHGHTHRPAMHRHVIDDQITERWVIPDWHDHTGGYLILDKNGLTACSLTI